MLIRYSATSSPLSFQDNADKTIPLCYFISMNFRAQLDIIHVIEKTLLEIYSEFNTRNRKKIHNGKSLKHINHFENKRGV